MAYFVPQAQIKAYAKMRGLTVDEASEILESVAVMYLNQLLHTKKVTIPAIGKFEIKNLHKSFPKKVHYSQTVIPKTLPSFIKNRRLPYADILFTPKDQNAFQELLSEAYKDSNADS